MVEHVSSGKGAESSCRGGVRVAAEKRGSTSWEGGAAAMETERCVVPGKKHLAYRARRRRISGKLRASYLSDGAPCATSILTRFPKKN